MLLRTTPSLQAVLATSLDAVVVIEETGIIVAWNENAELIFGYTKAEAINRQIAELIIPPNQQAAHHHGMDRFLTFGEVHILGKRCKLTAMHRDGHEFPVELAVTVYSEFGNRCFIGFIRDLTDETAAAAKMEALTAEVLQLSRLNSIGTIASMIAHELNQPLAAASNYLAACRAILSKAEGIELDHLAFGMTRAQEAIFRAAGVVKEVRETIAKRPMSRSKTHLRTLVTKTTKLLESRLAISSVLNFEPDAEHVLVNKEQLEQVFFNIMKNAIEAMHLRPDPVLIFSSKRDGQMVEICIQDNGPGLSEESKENLFSPFRSLTIEGLGIGLSICRTIVEEHGGRIWAKSDTTGTEFCFTLPAG